MSQGLITVTRATTRECGFGMTIARPLGALQQQQQQPAFFFCRIFSGPLVGRISGFSIIGVKNRCRLVVRRLSSPVQYDL